MKAALPARCVLVSARVYERGVDDWVNMEGMGRRILIQTRAMCGSICID
jgi:hypothetical protein